MLNRAISIRNCVLIVFVGIGSLAASGQTPTTSAGKFLVGTLDQSIRESSGIIASRKHAGVFWTLSDSGNPAAIYAVALDGTLLADYMLNVANVDWESIAQDDDGRIYIGDTGNNSGKLTERYVHRVAEPDVHAKGRESKRLKVIDTWTFRLPDRKFDIEAMFVLEGSVYLITKRLDLQQATVYRFALTDPAIPKELEKVTDLPIRAPVTDADISNDGKWLAVLSVAGPSLLEIDGDVSKAGKIAPASSTFLQPNAEAICFVDEGLLTTTEDRQMYLFGWEKLTGGPVPTSGPSTMPTTKPEP